MGVGQENDIFRKIYFVVPPRQDSTTIGKTVTSSFHSFNFYNSLCRALNIDLCLSYLYDEL